MKEYKSCAFLLLFVVLIDNSLCAKIHNNVVLKRLTSQDMDSSASGYYYHKANDGPTKVFYHGNLAELNLPQQLKPIQYKSSVGAGVGGGDIATGHSYAISHVLDNNHGGNNFGASAGYTAIPKPQHHQLVGGSLHNYNLNGHHALPLIDKSTVSVNHHAVDSGPKASHNSYSVAHHHDGHDKQFEEDDGSEYGDEHHKKHGETAKKHYDNDHKFEKGEKGDYAKENHEGHHEEDGGKKAHHNEDGEHYEAHHEGESGSKGGKFGEKKHHKKGSKTTGYHNVFHKDEYKKDHTFYDDVDHKGHFKKHGSDHHYHKGDSGKEIKGGHHDSAYKHGNGGKKGDFAKGNYDHDDHGYDKKHGYDTFHHEIDDFGKYGGSDGHDHHGFKGGHHY